MKLILKLQEWMNNLIHKEDGVTAIEYGLIAALIANPLQAFATKST